jgi:hypothetical protein
MECIHEMTPHCKECKSYRNLVAKSATHNFVWKRATEEQCVSCYHEPLNPPECSTEEKKRFDTHEHSDFGCKHKTLVANGDACGQPNKFYSGFHVVCNRPCVSGTLCEPHQELFELAERSRADTSEEDE